MPTSHVTEHSKITTQAFVSKRLKLFYFQLDECNSKIILQYVKSIAFIPEATKYFLIHEINFRIQSLSLRLIFSDIRYIGILTQQIYLPISKSEARNDMLQVQVF